MRIGPIVLFLAGVGGGVRAQAPGVPPTGPSRDDTLYALRVNPADHPGRDYVLLLDEGVVRIEADGRSRLTIREVVQILTPDGVDAWGQYDLWYDPARQRVTIERARVIDPDGKVLRERPEHEQEVAPTVEPSAPVYSDRRAIQGTLGGVAPGTLVDLEITRETFQPWLPGDFLYQWDLNGWVPVRRGRFTLDTPAGLEPRVVASNVGAPVQDTIVGDRRIRTWIVRDLPAVDLEEFAGEPNDEQMTIIVGGSLSWDEVAAWYGTMLTDIDRLSPEIQTAHDAQLRGARSLEDSLQATYRWIAQDFRYVSLDLGDGGYRPRAPSEVFASRFGDCKDKTIFFVSLLHRLGVGAYPVLVAADGVPDSLLPSLRHFDHMIAAVERRGRVEYADVTSSFAPFGELADVLQGKVGLAIRDGRGGIVPLPATLPDSNRWGEVIVGSLGSDGRLVGHITLSALGTEQYDLRRQLAELADGDATKREATLQTIARRAYTTAVVDTARYTDGRDLRTPPSVTVWFSAPNVVGTLGSAYYFNLPLLDFSAPDLLGKLEADSVRTFPIDVAQVNGPSVYRSSFEFQLPEGWKAEIPEGVNVRGPFGYYRTEFRQAGRTLTGSREMGGGRGVEPPDSAEALRAWLRALGADPTKMIVLHQGTGQPLTAGAVVDTGALPEIVLGLGDLPAGAMVTTEGGGAGDAGFMQSLSTTLPLESYAREFGTDQMVFTVGNSSLVGLLTMASAYGTSAEARRPIDLMELMDLRALMEANIGEFASEQASVGAVRSAALDSVGDRAAGWIIELVTPFATFDMAILFAARGRVTTTVLALGTHGMQAGDLVGLLRVMDHRVRQRRALLEDLDAGPPGPVVMRAVDSALAAATDLPLKAFLPPPPDSLGRSVSSFTFTQVDGQPTFTQVTQGTGLTFPLRGSRVIIATVRVALHEAPAGALKPVLIEEEQDRVRLIRSFLRNTGVGSEIGGFLPDSITLTPAVDSGIGTRSAAISMQVRGPLRMDFDVVVFARGRLSGGVILARVPGENNLATAVALARDMDQRIQRLVPDVGALRPSQTLLDAVRGVVRAESAVDSLVEAREFDAVFRTIDRARLSRAPVGFAAATWNSVCWWASLYGQAKRARAACEAAVAPDTTNLAYRDTRGLGRALAGDLKGAREDFEYVVAHTAAGAFLDQRAAWLESLRAGANPFTPDVIAALRKE